MNNDALPTELFYSFVISMILLIQKGKLVIGLGRRAQRADPVEGKEQGRVMKTLGTKEAPLGVLWGRQRKKDLITVGMWFPVKQLQEKSKK